MVAEDLPYDGYIHKLTNISFGRYHIRPGEKILDEAASNVDNIAIVTPDDVAGIHIEDQFETIKRIDYANGDPAYYVLRSKGVDEGIPRSSGGR